MSSLHSSPFQSPEPEVQGDKIYQFIEAMTLAIKRIYRDNGLPLPTFSSNEVLLLRKSIENTDIPLTLAEKVHFVVSYL